MTYVNLFCNVESISFQHEITILLIHCGQYCFKINWKIFILFYTIVLIFALQNDFIRYENCINNIKLIV